MRIDKRSKSDLPENSKIVTPSSDAELESALTSNCFIADPDGSIPMVTGGVDFDAKSLDEYRQQGQVLEPTGIRMKGSEIDLIKLSDNSIVSKERAYYLAKEGLLSGVITARSKYGECYIKNSNDGNEENNLQNLPKF